MAAVSFTLWVPGRPRSKERPRLGRKRKAYTPEGTLNAEARIAAAWEEAGGSWFDGSVYLEVDYHPEGQLITVSDADWKSPLANDIDNMLKLTGDALQGVAFADDRCVVALHGTKYPKGDLPPEAAE
jgi:Holliday junction resolvase RusA-like endonuclease